LDGGRGPDTTEPVAKEYSGQSGKIETVKESDERRESPIRDDRSTIPMPAEIGERDLGKVYHGMLGTKRQTEKGRDGSKSKILRKVK